MFALGAFYAYSHDYYVEKDGEKQEACDELWNCFSMMFDATFKIDGGWTGYYLSNINYG